MKRIFLTRGEYAMVDDEDFPSISSRRWYVLIRPGCKHAARTEIVDGRKRQIYMHRQITGARPGQLVDHANMNGLDNRKVNLRVCSKAENAWNSRRKIKNKTSRFKGVCLKTDRGKESPWLATITINRKQKYLGRFRTEIEAAMAYDSAAVEAFGKFSATNFNRRDHV